MIVCEWVRVRLRPLFILFKRNFYAHKYLCTHTEREKERKGRVEREGERQSEIYMRYMWISKLN